MTAHGVSNNIDEDEYSYEYDDYTDEDEYSYEYDDYTDEDEYSYEYDDYTSNHNKDTANSHKEDYSSKTGDSDIKPEEKVASDNYQDKGSYEDGVEDFEGSWEYFNQSGLISIEKLGNIYVMYDYYKDMYTYTTWRYIGEYDQNKKILVLNSRKVEEMEYNEATQKYDTREYTESIKGYIYTNGDGTLYWVEGRDEYNPNDAVSYIMPRINY